MPSPAILACTAPLVLVLAACRMTTPPTPSSPRPTPAGACTEIGCGPGVIVHFDRHRPWGYASYRVDVQADGQLTTCETKMPLVCDARPACSDPAISLEEVGCALAIGEQALGGVALATVPAHLAVRVYGDDTLLAEGTWSPEPRTTRPNGPDCEPTCVRADDVTLVLPPAD